MLPLHTSAITSFNNKGFPLKKDFLLKTLSHGSVYYSQWLVHTPLGWSHLGSRASTLEWPAYLFHKSLTDSKLWIHFANTEKKIFYKVKRNVNIHVNNFKVIQQNVLPFLLTLHRILPSVSKYGLWRFEPFHPADKKVTKQILLYLNLKSRFNFWCSQHWNSKMSLRNNVHGSTHDPQILNG